MFQTLPKFKAAKSIQHSTLKSGAMPKLSTAPDGPDPTPGDRYAELVEHGAPVRQALLGLAEERLQKRR